MNPEHLFLGTNADNVTDKMQKGRQANGQVFRSAKCNDELVRYIRGLNLSTRQIAKQFGIGKTTAHSIKAGRAWKHLTP